MKTPTSPHPMASFMKFLTFPIALAAVAVLLALSVEGAEPAGYLSRVERDLGKIRVETPPKPPVPPLAPLPQTYIPEPQFTAEFLSELKTTSAMHRTNFTVRADTSESFNLQMAPPVSAPVDPVPAGVGDDPEKSRQLLRYFLTQLNLTNGAAGMAGTSGAPVNIVLPLRMSSAESPARGTGRATYELR
jgi:hypothetical protein